MLCSAKCSKFREFVSDFDFLVLAGIRVTLGVIFVVAGYGKFGHLEQVSAYFGSAGIPIPHIIAPIVAAFELVCGGLIILGLWTRLASFALAVIMIVALFTAHLAEITSFMAFLDHFIFLMILLLLGLVTRGAGSLAIDAFFEKKANQQ